MAFKPLSRRSVLRGALGSFGAAISLPLLEAMIPSKALAQAAMAPPVRVGLWFWGGGVHHEKFVPSAVGHTFALTPQLLPFANVKSHLTVVTGFNNLITGTGHWATRCGATAGSYDNSMYGYATTPTFEQIAGNHHNGKTRFRALEVGVSQKGMQQYGAVNTAWNGASITPEYSPRALFDRLFTTGFSAGGASTQITNNKIKARRSVLDLTLTQSAGLRTQLGTSDKARLDVHLESIRDLEKRLHQIETTTVVSSCVTPGRPPLYPVTNGQEQIRSISRAFSDLLVVALACDLTRAFNFQINAMQSDIVLWEAGLNEGLHDLTHDSARRADTSKGITFLMGEYAYLCEKLAAVPEGNGTLLDNCCVLGTTEHADASDHSANDFPFIVAGKAGGALKGNLHVRGSGENSSRVHLSLLKACGLPVTSFGQGAGFANTAIPALLT
jgi:hypothetical protein